MLNNIIKINNHLIGRNCPVYIIAELSANHLQNYNRAVKLIKEAKKCGADAVKIQTYTPDTMTLNVDNEKYKITDKSLWKGSKLYDLYKKAYMPWEMQSKLMQVAKKINIDIFSTAYDATSVDYLMKLKVPAFKIASFEIIDIPLIEKVTKTGKPLIISTGMATLGEIEDAVSIVKKNGGNNIALLKCTSSYPSLIEDANLSTITNLRHIFNVPVGFSDHSLSSIIPALSTYLGANIVEKHFTLKRSDGGADSAFSLEPKEFLEMVKNIRIAEKAYGNVRYGPLPVEKVSLKHRKSIIVFAPIKKGEVFSLKNIKSLRPAIGLPPKYLYQIIGKKARFNMVIGQPVLWNSIE